MWIVVTGGETVGIEVVRLPAVNVTVVVGVVPSDWFTLVLDTVSDVATDSGTVTVVDVSPLIGSAVPSSST